MIPTIPPSFIRLADGAYPIPAWHGPDPTTHAEVFMDDPPDVPPGFVAELAEQPDEQHVLRYTLRPLDLDARRAEHLAGIDAQVAAKIRESYSIDDELYFARISVGSLLGVYMLEPGEAELLQQYQVVVEAARAWGREQKALI